MVPVASRASVVALMASMASMVAPLEWLNLMAAEPKSHDERVDGLTHKICEERADGSTLKTEGASTVALMMASVVAAWMAPVASLMASMAPIASMASMVAPMAPLVASLASMASMVAPLEWLNLMTEPKRGEERVDGLTQKNVKNELMGWLSKFMKIEPTDGQTKICMAQNAPLETECVAPMVLEDVMALVASMVAPMASMVVSMASNGGVDGFDGFDGVDGWLRWLRWVASMVVTGVFGTEGTDVEVPLCPQ